MIDTDKKPVEEVHRGSLLAWLTENELIRIGDWLGQLDDADSVDLWQPNNLDKQMAWQIYSELRSRVTTQHLPYRDGQDESALTSVYSLFKTVRDAAKELGPNTQVTALIAFAMLNKAVRPFTAKWHLRNLNGQLINNDERREFRRELHKLTLQLQLFEVCFARITGQTVNPDNSEKPHKPIADLDPRPRYFSEGFPEQMWQHESQEVVKRRALLGHDQPEYKNLCGLAISGGGMRSATFALGVSHKLARMGLFKHFDYISTVSGGTYLGSLITSRLNYLAEKTDKNNEESGQISTTYPYNPFDDTVEKAPNASGDTSEALISHLRDNGRYLLKNWGRAIALWIFGLAVNLVLIAALALCVAGVAHVLDVGISDVPGLRSVFQWLGSSLFFFGTFSACLLALLFVLVPWIRQGELAEQEIERLSAMFLGIFVLGSIGYAVFDSGYKAQWLCEPHVSCQKLWMQGHLIPAVFMALSIVVLVLAQCIGLARRAAKLLMILASVLAGFFVLSSIVAFANTPWVINYPVGSIAVGALMFAWLSQLDLNRASLSSYYRKGLAYTYLQTKPGLSADRPLSDQHAATPYQLIGTAVNLPTSKTRRLNERNADLFLFSPGFCGSRSLGYHPTEQPPFTDLKKSTAMVVSGAAVSPLAGRNTAYGFTPWLTILSIRLGFWLPNPKMAKYERKQTKPTPTLLWREFTGIANEESSHINVSDGGHIENLGIYELLKRRCQTIICIDGEADPLYQFDGLLRIIQMAKVDMDIDIAIDLSDLKPRQNGYSYSHFALGEITYPNRANNSAGPTKNNTGYLLYIKSSLTGNELPHTLDYRRSNPDFPHQPTHDQFFNEAQFESYRALGYHVAEDLFSDLNFAETLTGGEEDPEEAVKKKMQSTDGMQWFFQHLRSKLLPE